MSRMENEESRCRWSISNLSSLVTHPAMASDAEFQLHLVQFLFINAFFIIKHATSNIACVCETLSIQHISVSTQYCLCFTKFNCLLYHCHTLLSPFKSYRPNMHALCMLAHAHTHDHFTALWILSRITWVSRYQKKHSPTHTYRGHQSSLICFLHLL